MKASPKNTSGRCPAGHRALGGTTLALAVPRFWKPTWLAIRRGSPQGNADEFSELWSGYVAFSITRPHLKNAPEGRSSWAWLIPFFTRHQGIFLQALLLALAVSGLQLILPIATQVVGIA